MHYFMHSILCIVFVKTMNGTLNSQQYFVILFLFLFSSSVFIKCSCCTTPFFKTPEEPTLLLPSRLTFILIHPSSSLLFII